MRPGDSANSLHHLRSREWSGAAVCLIPDFARFQLDCSFDVYAAGGEQRADRHVPGGNGGAIHGEAGLESWPPFFLRRRSPIVEVLAVGNIVFALAQSGVCSAFCIGG